MIEQRILSTLTPIDLATCMWQCRAQVACFRWGSLACRVIIGRLRGRVVATCQYGEPSGASFVRHETKKDEMTWLKRDRLSRPKCGKSFTCTFTFCLMAATWCDTILPRHFDSAKYHSARNDERIALFDCHEGLRSAIRRVVRVLIATESRFH